MTWEETIQYIRSVPEYKSLVELAYFEEDLVLNVERFKHSEECKETLILFKEYAPTAQKILDIGAGNGISCIVWALSGFQVTVVEPDKSDTIGAGAIRKLKAHYNLENLTIYESFAEEIAFESETFDIVYARQCMHHAYDLNKFVAEASRVLKRNGLFITIRDHVIFGDNDKKLFLNSHPLQKYYGGENAFEPQEYENAMKNAALTLKKRIKFYDNIINYFPRSRREVEDFMQNQKQKRKENLRNKVSFLAELPFFSFLYNFYLDKKVGEIKPLDEREVPGRLYSYICIKE